MSDNFRTLELMVQSSKAFIDDNVDLAIQKANQSLILSPNNSEILSELGTYYFEKRELETAISCFSDSLNINPNNNDTREQLGSVYFELGDYELAVEQFSKILENEPKRLYTLVSLGEISLKFGQTELAKEYFTTVIDQKKNISLLKNLSVYANQVNIMKTTPFVLFSSILSLSNEFYVASKDISIAYANLIEVYELTGDEVNLSKTQFSYLLHNLKDKPLECIINLGLRFI